MSEPKRSNAKQARGCLGGAWLLTKGRPSQAATIRTTMQLSRHLFQLPAPIPCCSRCLHLLRGSIGMFSAPPRLLAFHQLCEHGFSK